MRDSLSARRLLDAAAVAVLALFVLLAIAGPWLTPHDPLLPDLRHPFGPPDAAHWLGTDAVGRDVLSRTIASTRLSLLLPLLVVVLSSVAGSLLGLLAAWRGGWLDALLSRGIDVLLAFPGLLLAIIVVARLGPGTTAPVVAVTLGSVPYIAVLVRASAFDLLRAPAMAAYRMQGFGSPWIAVRRVARHLVPVIGTQGIVHVGSSLLWLAGLSFLGLGLQPPDADWGLMLRDGREAALRGILWPALAPTLCLVLFVLSTHRVAERLKERLP